MTKFTEPAIELTSAIEALDNDVQATNENRV